MIYLSIAQLMIECSVTSTSTVSYLPIPYLRLQRENWHMVIPAVRSLWSIKDLLRYTQWRARVSLRVPYIIFHGFRCSIHIGGWLFRGANKEIRFSLLWSGWHYIKNTWEIYAMRQSCRVVRRFIKIGYSQKYQPGELPLALVVLLYWKYIKY